MQYSFALPADYDMGIVDRRVDEKGHFLDRHEPLLFKMYNIARQEEGPGGSRENLYAPFYLWKDTAGMNDFLCSAGFKGLVKSFGWPAVQAWPGVLAHELGSAREARWATRELVQLSPFTALDELRAAEAASARGAVQEGAVCALAAYEPTTWTLVRFRAWREAQHGALAANVQAYAVRHVSNPGAA